MDEVMMLEFEGGGYGMMQGITRYIVFTTEPDEDDQREPAPGFTLLAAHIVLMPSRATSVVDGDMLIPRT